MSKISWVNAQSANYCLSHLLSKVTMTIGIVRFVLQCLFFFTAPSKRMRFCLKTEIFFHIDLPSTRTRWKWSPKTHLFKNFLHSEDFFENAGPLVYVSMDENEGFPIRWCNTSFTTSITHALWGMLSYFQCLAFSYGQAKTIRIRHVWTRIFLENGGEKISFSKISGYLWTEPASLIFAKERLNIFYTAASKRFKMNFPRGCNTTMKSKLH